MLIETERDGQTGLLKGYDDKYIKILLEGDDKHKSKILAVRVEEAEQKHTFGVLV